MKNLNAFNSLTPRFTLVSSAMIAAASLFVATSAFAQDAPPEPPAEETPAAESAPEQSEPTPPVVEAKAAPEAIKAASQSTPPKSSAKTSAQKSDSDSDAKSAASKSDSSSESSESNDEEAGPLQEQIDEYWSVEGRDLDTLNDRLYSKDGRFIVSLSIGTIPTSPFWIYLDGGLRFTYFFNEYYGLEVSGSYLYGFDSTLQVFLKKELGDAFHPDLDIGDKGLFRTDALFIWKPFYGKFGLFNKKLAHFDFNFAIGVGIYGVKRPDPAKKEAVFAAEVEGVLGAGFSVFLSQDWTFRFDTRAFMVRGAETVTAKTFAQRLTFPTELSFGFSYLF